MVGIAVGIAWFAGCRSPGPAHPDPARLARADAELAAGCHDCLIAARAGYRALATGAARPELAARVLEADLLLALREKELDLPPSDALAEARRIAAELPRELEAARYVALVDSMPSDAPGLSPRPGVVRIRMASRAEFEQLRSWLARGRLRAMVRDYLWLAIDCTYAVPGGGPEHPPAEAPPGAPPLLAYRAASCGLGTVAALAAVRDREPRFVETSLFMANIELAAEPRDGPGHAGAHLAEALAHFPASPAITYLAGAYQRLVDNDPEALRRYDQALALQPGHDRALLGRVICLTHLGRHDEAIEAATRLIELDERSRADAYYWRAHNRHELHQLALARADIDAARRLAMTASVLDLAGILEYEQHELLRAEDDLTIAQDLSIDCTARWYLALIHRERKRWLAAGHAFEQAVACYRDRGSETAGRLQALQTRGDLDPVYRERTAAGLQGSIDADAKQQHVAALMAAADLVAGGDPASARPLVDLAGEDPELADPVSKLRARLDPPPRTP